MFMNGLAMGPRSGGHLNLTLHGKVSPRSASKYPPPQKKIRYYHGRVVGLFEVQGPRVGMFFGFEYLMSKLT